jgi:hypothetical protein
MDEEIRYNDIRGSQVAMLFDGHDYEVKLNGAAIMTTGDEFEASMVAEAIDTALSILNAQNLLSDR